jgi:hypothetical protein
VEQQHQKVSGKYVADHNLYTKIFLLLDQMIARESIARDTD